MSWRPPEELVTRARGLADGSLVATTPRDASTVVLVRDTADGLEVHLQRRVATMAFAAGMHVFPGGRVDEADLGVPVELPDGWPALLGADAAQAGAIVVAACRETLEESGVLIVDDASGIDVAAARLRPFVELGVSPSTTLMRPWARWVTPEFEVRRYDTRFFVARLPEGQQAAGDDAGGEADRALWLTPDDALARHRAGELAMLPPTVFTLGELTAYPTSADLLAAATGRDLKPVLPRLLVDGDEVEFLVNGD